MTTFFDFRCARCDGAGDGGQWVCWCTANDIRAFGHEADQLPLAEVVIGNDPQRRHRRHHHRRQRRARKTAFELIRRMAQ